MASASRISATRALCMFGCGLALACPAPPAPDHQPRVQPQSLPTFAAVAERALVAQPGHLEHAAVRFTIADDAWAALVRAASVEGTLAAPLPAGTTIGGSLGARLGTDATHHRLHLADGPAASLSAWVTAAAHDAVGDGRPAVCEAVAAPCIGDQNRIAVRRTNGTAVTLDIVVATPVTAQHLRDAQARPLTPSAATHSPGHLAVDVDNERLRTWLSPAPSENSRPPLPLRSLHVRAELDGTRMRARARWTADRESTAPWRARDAQIPAPALDAWCGTSPCVLASAVPSPAELRRVFVPLRQESTRGLGPAEAVLQSLAFGWPHALAAATQTPLAQLQAPAVDFVAAAIEVLGTVDAAGLRQVGGTTEAFVRAPKPTIDLAAGLLAYVGAVRTVDSGGEQVSLVTSASLPSPVFLSLDDDGPQSDGWIAVVANPDAFADLRKQPVRRYGPPWVYASVPGSDPLALKWGAEIHALRMLATVEDAAFVLDVEARVGAAP